ncbi:MAG TPA: trigger factor [Solirubrobacteraceae bacterium]|jgi:trigger factor
MAAAPVTTTVEELPESRVRVQAEVAPEEIERRLNQAARQLGRDIRVPGFRTGKVPPPVIIKRIGRDAVLDEAVRDSLGRWYAAAIDAARIVPVGDPDIDIDLAQLPPEGEPLRFSIEIGVRPTATLGEYKGLEVGKREPEVPEETIDQEIERLRERTATLETVERPAQTGDYVVMDFLGTLEGVPFQGGEGRDQMVELGSGRLVPGFEDQLAGATAGEERTVSITFPADYGAEDLAGKEAEFAVTVKEIKEKHLPDLDDDFAADQGFDTMDELRADIRERTSEAETGKIEAEFRETALDAAVANATVEVPDALVEARAREMWEQTAHSLSHQGIQKEMYLQISGKTEDEIVEDGKEDAAVGLRREAVLAAVVEAEGIEPSEDELLEAVAPSAERERTSPKKLLERLRSAGRLEDLQRDLATRKAVDVIADSATAITVEQAEARGKLWTPASGASEAGGQQLWTPGA